jgi:hypothetical protein
MSVEDFCNDGEPFGIQSVGLAYSPEEMLNRGYSIIHSVRNYTQRQPEDDVRDFFKSRR